MRTALALTATTLTAAALAGQALAGAMAPVLTALAGGL
jgi:hypothetical protein